jgi:putative intracellular protease/amidase/YHS domain-containing protein
MRTLPRRYFIPFAILCWTLVSQLVPEAHADQPTTSKPTALKGLDPVLLVAGKETKGQPEISVVREEFRYVFADAANKARFEKDPERYAIQFHGGCAMMPNAPADPDLFTVYKGRIYAFGSKDCQDAFQAEPEQYVHQKVAKSVQRKSVVILVFPGMELLDFTGPLQVFLSAGCQVSTVAVTRDPVPCVGVITIAPDYTLADCPRADILVIPGGSRAISKDKRVTDWVAKAAPETEATLSVCTGAFTLAEAGLLDGKEATTHHGSIQALRKQFPKITVHADRRIVDNGKIVVVGGVSSGIDGALYLVDRLLGRDKANATARYMEYPWQPPAEKKS